MSYVSFRIVLFEIAGSGGVIVKPPVFADSFYTWWNS